MTYILHFLPEVEADLIAGYTWYDGRLQVWAKNSFECFMLVQI